MLLTYLLRNFHLALGFAGSLLWPPEKAGHRQQELRANVTGQVSRGGPPEWRKGEDTLAEKPVLSLNSKHLLTPSIADGLAGLPHYFLSVLSSFVVQVLASQQLCQVPWLSPAACGI
jgi:hypothetical protein